MSSTEHKIIVPLTRGVEIQLVQCGVPSLVCFCHCLWRSWHVNRPPFSAPELSQPNIIWKLYYSSLISSVLNSFIDYSSKFATCFGALDIFHLFLPIVWIFLILDRTCFIPLVYLDILLMNAAGCRHYFNLLNILRLT